MKKIFAPLLSLVLAAALSVPAFAYELKSFSDLGNVSKEAYEAIMAMAQKGIIGGTTAPDEKGVGTFNPQSPMTRAQFIAIITRYLYKDELAGMSKSDIWYGNNYAAAAQHGLIKGSEFAIAPEVMNVPMTRQEMARVLVRAMGELGEDTSAKVSKNRIPDFHDIGDVYQDYVRTAYKAGLICGTNKQGTFNPKGVLNRTQASIVIYRLIEPSKRIAISDEVVKAETPATGATWVEGEQHSPEDVKPGATVIKADGTKVVLQEVKVGNIYILGFGQGVDFISGTVINDDVLTEGAFGGAWLGFNGNDLTKFIKDPISGEVHTSYEWKQIKSSGYKKPDFKGSTDGQKEADYWEWDAALGLWLWTGPSV